MGVGFCDGGGSEVWLVVIWVWVWEWNFLDGGGSVFIYGLMSLCLWVIVSYFCGSILGFNWGIEFWLVDWLIFIWL